MKRREFIKVVSVAASSVAIGPLGWAVAEAADDTYRFDPARPAGDRFPQSVMSGDPKPDSVILWTRVQSSAAQATVAYQVAKSPDFNAILAQGTYNTGADMDYTVRIKLTNLEPATRYYYRFIFDNTASKVGRTKTAPAPDSDVEIKFAYISCQDYTNGYYVAFNAMAQEDLDFVVHVGDYVYETTGAGFQGGVRNIPLPDGGDLGQGGKFATTINDYRTLYKTYRTDPQLQAVQEAFPWIVIWDDHEFSNDCWGDNATYFNEAKNETEPDRRKAASRAWYEFMPADIGAYDDSQTYDRSLTIYRSFRFGKRMELIMTDERMYRSDHLIPEGPAIAAIQKPANSEIGSRYFVPKFYFDAVEKAKPAISMLGSTQKDWFKQKLANSTATWKVWGNEVSLIRMLVDISKFGATTFYMDLDEWDGYNRERSELMKFIKDSQIQNVVAISGDIHAFFAGPIYENFDDQSQPAAMVDFTTAGVTSQPFYYALYGPAATPGSPFAALEPVLRYNPATDSNGVDAILQASNPHIKHVRTLAYGYTSVIVKPDAFLVRMNEVSGIDSRERAIKRAFNFRVPAGQAQVIAEQGSSSPDPGAERWLAATGFYVDDRQGFLSYWRRNGGLKAFGYPISPVLDENGKQVQYFERQRFESFPTYPTPYKVQLGLLGRWAAQKVTNQSVFAPVAARSGSRFYKETGHNTSPLFQAFWDNNGGLPIFGFPISEEFEEVDSYGKTRKTQYFERVVLRYFPENPAEYQAQGDLLGTAYYRAIYFKNA